MVCRKIISWSFRCSQEALYQEKRIEINGIIKLTKKDYT